MRRAWIIHGFASAWLVFLTIYSFRLWGAVFTGTRWDMWLGAATDAAVHLPGLVMREPAMLAGPLVLIAGLLLGRALLRRLLPETPPWPLALAAGLVVLSLVALGLGSVGLFRPAWLLGLSLIATAAGLTDFLFFSRAPAAVSRLSRLESALFAPWLALGLLTAVNPTLFYDALYYHLPLPRLYLRTGEVAPHAWHVLSYFPSGAELLFGMGLAGGSMLASQLFLLGVWAAAALSLRDLAARFFGPRAALPTLAVTLSVLAFLLSSLMVAVDTLVLLFSAGGLYCLLGAWQAAAANDRAAFARWSAGWALMAGGAGGIKYTAWISVMTIPFALLLFGSRRLGKWGLAASVLAGTAAFLVLLPWPIRNYLACGNPIMPMNLGNIFPGLPPESWRALLIGAHPVTWSAKTIGENLLFPWTMFFSDWDKLSWEWGAASFVGPAIWAGTPLWLLAGKRSAQMRPLAVYALAALAASIWTIQITRYAFPALGAWCVVAGAGVAALTAETPRWLRALTGTALSLMLALSLALGMRATANLSIAYRYPRLNGDLLPYLAVRSGQRTYSGAHVLQLKASRLLPPDARVLMAGDGTFFFLDRDAEAVTFLSPNRLLELLKRQPDDRLAAGELLRAGFTHVLVSYAELERFNKYHVLGYTPELEARIKAFVRGPYCRLLLEEPKERAELCELLPAAPASR